MRVLLVCERVEGRWQSRNTKCETAEREKRKCGVEGTVEERARVNNRNECCLMSDSARGEERRGEERRGEER